MQARNKYLTVARQMKEFEDKKYDAWREATEGILPSLLKRNLLAKPVPTIGTAATSTHPIIEGVDNAALETTASGHNVQGEIA